MLNEKEMIKRLRKCNSALRNKMSWLENVNFIEGVVSGMIFCIIGSVNVKVFGWIIDWTSSYISNWGTAIIVLFLDIVCLYFFILWFKYLINLFFLRRVLKKFLRGVLK